MLSKDKYCLISYVLLSQIATLGQRWHCDLQKACTNLDFSRFETLSFISLKQYLTQYDFHVILRRHCNYVPLFLDKSAQLKIIFLISPSKHILWLLKEPSQWIGSFKYQNKCYN